MSTNLWRLRATVALPALLALALALPGCGDGYGRHHHHSGTLEIVNDPASVNDIDAFEITLVGGGTDHFDVVLAPGDSFTIDLDADDYDVELFWSDATTDLQSISILEDFTTTVTGLN